MMEAVHRYEGTVDQVMGDGVMALFGAPIGHEDHAVRACYAALRMERRVNLYANEIQRGGGTPVYIRVGLNSGEVVVGSIGSDHMVVGSAPTAAIQGDRTASALDKVRRPVPLQPHVAHEKPPLGSVNTTIPAMTAPALESA